MSALIKSVKIFNKFNQNPAAFLTLVRKAGRKLNFHALHSKSMENIRQVRLSGERFVGYLRNTPNTNTYILQTSDDKKSLSFN